MNEACKRPFGLWSEKVAVSNLQPSNDQLTMPSYSSTKFNLITDFTYSWFWFTLTVKSWISSCRYKIFVAIGATSFFFFFFVEREPCSKNYGKYMIYWAKMDPKRIMHFSNLASRNLTLFFKLKKILNMKFLRIAFFLYHFSFLLQINPRIFFNELCTKCMKIFVLHFQ